ncbi:MAG: FtsX-like permease family protein [Pirellula sp.]
MNLVSIAIRNLMYRKLPTALTMLSMALGVALVVLVLTISGVIEKTFERTSNVGYNLIVGTKGSDIQLTFNSVFFLSQPIENLKYSYFMEFMPEDGRQKEYERVGGILENPDRKGFYADQIKGGFAIPLCMGDYVGSFRCIGTTPDYFNLLKHGEENDKSYKFAAGRNFVNYSNDNGYFEAVIGSQVANEMKLTLADKIFAAHGKAGGAEHEQGFKIVGILAPTGTPNDRGAFVNIEGFYLLEGHVAPERDASGKEKPGSAVAPQRESALSKVMLPIDKREITSILVKTDPPIKAIQLERQVNKTENAQAVSPIKVISGLMLFFLNPIKWAMLAITSLVCIVSAISILVSIYNSMSERKRDIAVMRALGASRDHVTMIILVESILIAVLGGIIGWILGHSIGPLANPWTEPATGVRIDFFSVNSSMEPLIVPGLILIGTLAGIIPAMSAYRTSVAKSL